MPKLHLILVDAQGIYVDKIYQIFYEKKINQKCPVGCVKEEFCEFC